MGFIMLILIIVFFVLLYMTMNDSKVQSYRSQKEKIREEMDKCDIRSKKYQSLQTEYNNLEMNQKAYQTGKALGTALQLGAVSYLVGKDNEEKAEKLHDLIEKRRNDMNELEKKLKEKYGF